MEKKWRFNRARYQETDASAGGGGSVGPAQLLADAAPVGRGCACPPPFPC